MMTRYSFGGDEHLVVEVDEAMSLRAFLAALSICNAIRDSQIQGVTEICPSNASFQLRFDPDLIAAEDLLAEVKKIEASLSNREQALGTRVLEIPVFYDDPWTREVMARFSDRRQDPEMTDLEYVAHINGLSGPVDYVARHSGSPWMVTMVGFGAGSPFMFQMVEQDQQLQVPKYVRPRTDTPKQCVSQGGCFTGIYPVRGAGGYQMLGVTPLPIYDPTQTTSYLQEFMILFRPGDIVRMRPIGRNEYDDLAEQVKTGDFQLRQTPASFSLDDFERDIKAFNQQMLEAIDGH
ncbi:MULTISPECIES: carboxyltransferase domain-containing protein [unclassified Mesorhizobium]|uniref:5-oxoprolinase subunit B family protein n=1 Tax=unclassified Mesorhizobium TaxID=325217 RepID=UPI002417F52A|nr:MULTISPECIES: carboxyltransferase domain-containing protein [unclassified Mesorhizobium]WFP65574.1 carboxyltransferase domain-containing protein [Mesorhizobium sp. WSM4904]WFP78839.1 carboxyltransferase domain-containing protein [Mesorhizobium sp. WSM4906]